MSEADRHLEEEMEAERRKAVELAAERAKRMDEFHRDYRYTVFRWGSQGCQVGCFVVHPVCGCTIHIIDYTPCPGPV